MMIIDDLRPMVDDFLTEIRFIINPESGKRRRMETANSAQLAENPVTLYALLRIFSAGAVISSSMERITSDMYINGSTVFSRTKLVYEAR
jgi:hypothetical protein